MRTSILMVGTFAVASEYRRRRSKYQVSCTGTTRNLTRYGRDVA